MKIVKEMTEEKLARKPSIMKKKASIESRRKLIG
jgi:hypothetical protein